MSKPVVFLDFDGVLNDLWEENGYAMRGELDPARVAVLNEILEATGAEVVLSTTWHKLLGGEEAWQRLRAAGLREGTVLRGTTPFKSSYRSNEIEWYLRDHPEVQTYVILDDDATLVRLRQASSVADVMEIL